MQAARGYGETVQPATRLGKSASRRVTRKTRVARMALAVCLLSLGACKTAPAPESTTDQIRTMSTTPDWSVANLGPGDVVKLTVVGHPDLSSDIEGVPLDESGALHIPVAGAIQLGGIGMAEANERVLEALSSFMRDPNASLTLIDRRSKVFHIVGHIREPGKRTILRPLNALEAVSEGGFFLNAADRKNVFLVRPHGDEIEVHRFNVETPGVEGLVQILPGDIVFVRRRGSQRFQEEFLPLLAPFNLAIPIAAVAL